MKKRNLFAVSSFYVNGIIFSFLNTYGLTCLQAMRESGIKHYLIFVSIGSIVLSMTYLSHYNSLQLTYKFGARVCGIVGSSIAAITIYLSSFLFCDNYTFIFSNNLQLNNSTLKKKSIMVENECGMISDESVNFFNYQFRLYSLLIIYSVICGMSLALTYTAFSYSFNIYFPPQLNKITNKSKKNENGKLIRSVMSLGAPILSPPIIWLLKYCLYNFGVSVTLRFFAVLISTMCPLSAFFLPSYRHGSKKRRQVIKNLKRLYPFDYQTNYLGENTPFVIWCIVVPLSLFAYFIPYLHLIIYADYQFGDKKIDPPKLLIVDHGHLSSLPTTTIPLDDYYEYATDDIDTLEKNKEQQQRVFYGKYLSLMDIYKRNQFNPYSEILLTLLCFISGITCVLISVMFSESKLIKRLYLHQFTLLLFGVILCLVPVAKDFSALVIITLIIGCSEGAAIGISSTILPDLILQYHDYFDRKNFQESNRMLFESDDVARATSILMFLCGITVAVGPILFAYIFHRTSIYSYTFFSSGCVVIIAALLLNLVIYLLKKRTRHNLHRRQMYDEDIDEVVECQSSSLISPTIITNEQERNKSKSMEKSSSMANEVLDQFLNTYIQTRSLPRKFEYVDKIVNLNQSSTLQQTTVTIPPSNEIKRSATINVNPNFQENLSRQRKELYEKTFFRLSFQENYDSHDFPLIIRSSSERKL
ncbi:hypothetical protein SNEBB_001479 [Seison nebaliae]|nr:hypothetical protein SNEBB_001479 [Seison nebaliae]